MVSEIHVEGDSKHTIRHIKAGLEAALYDFDIQVPDENHTGFKDKNIKIQKLVYRIIEDYNLPVIHTWYRYGQFEPYETLRPRYVNPKPLDEPQTAITSDTYADTITQEELKGYFLESGLEEIWNQPLFDFLSENYREWAPREYREAYLANLQILNILDSIEGDNDLSKNAPKYAKQLQDPSIDLRYELKDSNRFGKEVQDHVETFLDELQSAFVALASTNDPKATQLRAIKRSHSLYHEYIWPWPAMIISLNRAEGPKGELNSEFLPKGRELLRDFQRTFPENLTNWQKEIHSTGLQSTPTQFERVYGTSSSALGTLEKAALYGLQDAG